ncbi:hypothetical protein GCM10010429_50250 [Micromonospora olivasterospora]
MSYGLVREASCGGMAPEEGTWREELRKTRLKHAFSAIALNLTGLDAWWNNQPLDRTGTSYLARLDYALAA